MILPDILETKREDWFEVRLPLIMHSLRDELTIMFIESNRLEFHHGDGTPIMRWFDKEGNQTGWVFYVREAKNANDIK